jgi:hypothetical protein
MKTKIFILAAASLLLACSLRAQEAGGEKIQCAPPDFYISSGFFAQPGMALSPGEFQLLAPGSTLLPADLSEYSWSGYAPYNSNNSLSVQLGLRFRNCKKTDYLKNPVLRLGISYYSAMNASGSLFRSEHKSYDTLTSSVSGQLYYMDSVTRYDYYLRYASRHINLEGAVIFRTKWESRWSLFAGAGISGGMSVMSNTDIDYAESRGTEMMYHGEPYSGFHGLYESDYTSKTEHFRNSPSWNFAGFIPMGADLKLGRKNIFWKHVHLYYEMKPGISVLIIPGLNSYTRPGIQHALGLRVSMD